MYLCNIKPMKHDKMAKFSLRTHIVHKLTEMKFLAIALVISVATCSPVKRVMAPGIGEPTPVTNYEPIAVGPALVDSYEPIAVGPAIVDSYESISVGPAIVDSFEPISVGPAIIDSYEPIAVGPALVDSPTVSLIININKDSTGSNVVSVESAPPVISPIPPADVAPEAVSVVENAPESVTVIDGFPDTITVVDSVQNPIVSVDMSLIQEIIAAILSPNTHPSTAAVLEAQLQELLGPQPIAVGPAIVDSKPEEMAVGPEIVDVFEPIAVGPAVVDNYEPISVGPVIVDNFESISVGPAIVDNYEPIAVGPVVVDNYEPISVGPAIVDNYEPIAVGPVVVDNYEPISVGPAIIDPVEETAIESPDGAVPTESSASPIVQIVLNIVQDQTNNIEIPDIVHDAVSIVESAA